MAILYKNSAGVDQSTPSVSEVVGTTLSDLNTKTGLVTETVPASDTASSGLNGRLQRIAQRLTSIIGQLPATLGQKAKAASLSVVVASDQGALDVSGTVAANVTLPVGAQTYGTITVTASAVQAASVACRRCHFKARDGNLANLSIGGSGVTTATGYELTPGAQTPWMNTANLNEIWVIGANTTDKVDYITEAT
jgi:hypothetical protein